MRAGPPILGAKKREKQNLIFFFKLVLVRVWICFCLLVNFKWSFLYFYNVRWKLVPLRPEVWARGKTFEVCLLSSFVHQNKSKQNSNPFIIFDNHGRFLHYVSEMRFFSLEW